MLGTVRHSVLGISLRALGTLGFGLSLFLPAAEAGVIVAYGSVNTSGDLAPIEVADGVVSIPLRRGPGISAASGSTYNSRNWTTETTPQSDGYLEWGWSNSETSLSLESMDLRYDRSSSGPRQLEIQLSVNDGGFATIFTDPTISSSGETQFGIDLSQFQNVQSATFRLFAFEASSTNGTFDLETFSDNRALIVSSSAAVPEPTGLILSLLTVGCFGGVSGVRRWMNAKGNS